MPKQKPGRDSSGTEEAYGSSTAYGEPHDWSFFAAHRIGAHLFWSRRLTWLGLAVMSAAIWAFAAYWLSYLSPRRPDPDTLFVVLATVAIFVELTVAGTGRELLTQGETAPPGLRIDWLLRLPSILGVLLFLGAGLSMIAAALQAAFTPLSSAWYPSRSLAEILLLYPALRCGCFALFETAFEGEGPLDSLRNSWRLTGSLVRGHLFPVILYFTMWVGFLMAGGATFVLTSAAQECLGYEARGWFFESGVAATFLTGIALVMIYVCLVWTTHHLAQKRRLP